MKGVVFLGDRKLELREFPDPTPGPRDVILEIKASGMCGSDLHIYRAPAQASGAATGGIKRQAGVIAGHEPCGVVAAVGAGVSEKEARVGERVMDHHYDGCGTCKHCRAGWTQMCLEGSVVYGSGGHGGHARYMKVPVSTLVPLPDALSFVTGAAISCGTGTAWGALRRLNLQGGETIASRRRSSPWSWVRASSPSTSHSTAANSPSSSALMRFSIPPWATWWRRSAI
jgi:D-arabinose 1-dehydrogenase-like Zn-dependent alcohol dehydrogenase